MSVDMDNFTYFQKGNYDNQFEIDGLYYCLLNSGISIYYFWSDGTFCSYGAGSMMLKDDCNDIGMDKRETPWFWGAYIVKNDTLLVQMISGQAQSPEYPIHLYKAKIIDRKTLHFFQWINSAGDEVKWMNSKGDECGFDRTYHFHKCANKPDSLNFLMEDGPLMFGDERYKKK
jgi:hypothetical protein